MKYQQSARLPYIWSRYLVVTALLFLACCKSSAQVTEQSIRDAILNRSQSGLTQSDLNGDGKVDVADLVLRARYLTSVSFAQTSTIANEGAGIISVNLTLTSPLSAVFQYTVGGTAVPGKDYVPLQGTFAVNGTNASIPIRLIDNLIIDGTRTITLNLTAPPTNSATFALGTQSMHTVVIQDNDADWTGTLTTEGLQLPFDMVILQSNNAFQGTYTSDGSGTFTAGQWPVVLNVTSNSFNATIGPIQMQNTKSLLNLPLSRWLYLSSNPSTNAQHILNWNSTIVGSMTEEFLFQGATNQQLNRAGANAIQGVFTLQKPTPSVARSQPSFVQQ
jgi:hypothetical protein